MDDQLNNANQPGVQPDAGQPLPPYQGPAPTQPDPMQQPVAPAQPFVQPNQPPMDTQPQPVMPLQDVQMDQQMQPQQTMPMAGQQPMNQMPMQQPNLVQNPASSDPFAPDISPGPKKSKKTLIIVLIIVLLLVVAGIAFFLMSRSNSSDVPNSDLGSDLETVTDPTLSDQIDTPELSATTPLEYKVVVDEVQRGFEAAGVTEEQEVVVLKVTITNEGTSTTGAPAVSDMVLVSEEKEYLPSVKADAELKTASYEKLVTTEIPAGQSVTGYIAFVTTSEPKLTFRYKQPEVKVAATADQPASTIKAINVDIAI